MQTTNLKKFILPVLVVLFFTLFYLAVGRKSYITVTGTYSSQESNQQASFGAYLESKNADKQVAVDNLSERTEAVMTALRDFGIPQGDLMTTTVNVYQEQLYNPDTSRSDLGDWIASTNIEVKLAEGDRAQELISLLTSLDINNYYGPNYTYSNENVDQSALLTGAYENAVEKAQSMAQLRGMRLGRMVSFVEGYSPDSPIIYGRMDGLGGGGGVPVEPGTSEISKTVTVTFELSKF